MPVEEFTARLEKLVTMMKSTPTAPEYDEVMVAGDPEWRTQAQRLRDGLPIEQGNWEMLLKTAARGLPLRFAKAACCALSSVTTLSPRS